MPESTSFQAEYEVNWLQKMSTLSVNGDVVFYLCLLLLFYIVRWMSVLSSSLFVVLLYCCTVLWVGSINKIRNIEYLNIGVKSIVYHCKLQCMDRHARQNVKCWHLIVEAVKHNFIFILYINQDSSHQSSNAGWFQMLVDKSYHILNYKYINYRGTHSKLSAT